MVSRQQRVHLVTDNLATPLRVHLLIDSLAYGGAEALVGDLAIAARGSELELTVGYLGGRGAAAQRLRNAGIEPVEVPVRSLLRGRDRREVHDHVAAVAPDLLHTHLHYSDLLGGLAARSLDIPCVSTLHVAWWGGTLRERLRHRVVALARRRCATRVVAVSEAARRVYLRTGWDRPERVVTIHNGVSDETRPGIGPEIRRELGIASSDLVLGMVSVLRGFKGHEVAAAAVRDLLDRFPQLRLLVVGDGPKREELERSMRSLTDRVVFAGYRHDVTALLDAVDILVHPSMYDAFPTALLQAMAAGVPTIAARVGGIPEAITDGDNGILIATPARADQLGIALERLLMDVRLRREMAARARARYEAEFSAERWVGRLLALYRGLLPPSGFAGAVASSAGQPSAVPGQPG
jgi:glycosyltransferase involved in cell wall biosynthesis